MATTGVLVMAFLRQPAKLFRIADVFHPSRKFRNVPGAFPPAGASFSSGDMPRSYRGARSFHALPGRRPHRKTPPKKPARCAMFWRVNECDHHDANIVTRPVVRGRAPNLGSITSRRTAILVWHPHQPRRLLSWIIVNDKVYLLTIS